MSWLTPQLALLAAAVAVPALVILYFLKLRRRTVEISSTLLWKKAVQDLQANAPFQRLRRNILLLLQLLVLGAALFAVAQPQQRSETGGGRRLVLIIDRSASMNAVEVRDGPTRLEQAKREALALVETMRSGGVLESDRGSDQAMIVAFDSGGEVVAPFTADRAELRRAIESISPTDARSSIREAFKLAQAQRPRRIVLDNAGGAQADTALEVEGLFGGPSLDFHLFSDGRVGDLREVVLREDRTADGSTTPDTDAFTYHAIGSPAAVNLGVIDVRAERDYLDPARVSVFVGVQSSDRRARSVDVELTINGDQIAAVRTVELAPAEVPQGSPDGVAPVPSRSGVVFTLDRTDGFVARARLTGLDDPAQDALAADDAGLVIVPPAKRTGVAVVTAGNLFITEALGGLPLSRLETLAPAQFDAVLARDAGRVPYDVVVLDGHLPPGGAEGRMPPGRYLVLNAVPAPPFGLVDGGPGGPSSILNWSRTHPALRDVVLDGVRIAEFRRVEVPEGAGAAVLAESPQGPAIIEVGSAEARALIVPWDVAKSNWPFDVGFVVFLASAVEYLTADAAGASELGTDPRQLRPGQVLSARLPAGASGVRVVGPEGDRSPELAPGPDGTVLYGPLARAGLYRVEWSGAAAPGDAEQDGRASRAFAANVADPDESDLAAAAAIDLGSRGVAARSGRTRSIREYWPWLVLAALAIAMVEWWVFNRKVHV
jgi:hypothetical protein